MLKWALYLYTSQLQCRLEFSFLKEQGFCFPFAVLKISGFLSSDMELSRTCIFPEIITQGTYFSGVLVLLFSNICNDSFSGGLDLI